MEASVAAALRDAGVVKRLHLTHIHLDHRSRQEYFVGKDVTCPEIERPAFVDWATFAKFSGFDQAQNFDFHEWRKNRFHVEVVPEILGLKDGEQLHVDDMEARLLLLPGHTMGHSGIWFPA